MLDSRLEMRLCQCAGFIFVNMNKHAEGVVKND